MDIKNTATLLSQLKPQERKFIYQSKDGTKVFVDHTGKFSPQDFAVGLKIPGKDEFRPTHIRLLVDLYIKKESNPEDAKKLFLAFEKMYEGEDPEKLAKKLDKLKFPMKFDSPETNLYYAQLLMIEQDFNFGPGAPKRSKLNPPREYLMRFIRWVASGDSQLDRIIFAAAGRKYPAPEKYSKKLEL